jgi:hypothetical protein
MRAHNFALYGRRRPARTAGSTAVPCILLIRMRSQVQVLAGPPPITPGHSAAGNQPGAVVACLGRAGAARLPPPARPPTPPGPPTRASATMTTTHRGRAPSTGRQRRGRCGHLAPQPAPVPTAQPPATGAPHAGLACLVAQPVKRGRRARTHPARSATDIPLTNVRPRQRRPPPGLLGRPTEPLDGTAATGTSTGSCGDGCPRGASLVPTPRPVWRRQTRPDRRVDTSRLDTGRVDTRGLDAGRVDSRRPDCRTPDDDTRGPDTGRWTPDGRTGRRPRMGGHRMPDTGDRRHGRVLAVSSTATAPARWRLRRQTPSGRSTTRTAQQLVL